MGHPDGNAQSRLPISLELVPTEIKIPVGNAVQLRKHDLLAVLMHRRLNLLGGGQLNTVAMPK